MNDDSERKERLAKFLGEAHMNYIINVVKRPASQAEFALWLGVNPQTYTRLINGHSLPKLDNMIPIADRLGPEVYDICGIPRLAPSDPKFQRILDEWHGMSSKEQHRLIENLNQIVEERQQLPNGLQVN